MLKSTFKKKKVPQQNLFLLPYTQLCSVFFKRANMKVDNLDPYPLAIDPSHQSSLQKQQCPPHAMERVNK